MESETLVLPELSQGESYHVFCSYSSTDQQWAQSLIQQLEDRGLRVCDPDRDSIAGGSILEDMPECIGQSQKVLLLLSAEFVRSRWCLLEANMSMFRDCLQRKPIVPVLLQRDVHIPLHLSHITYLDIHNPDFIQQLLRVLWTPNQELQASTVVPYQPPSLYNGKSLQPLPAVNEAELSLFDCGVWNDDAVPHQLQQIIQQPERYSEAMKTINKVSQKKVKYRSFTARLCFHVTYYVVILVIAVGLGLLFTWPISSSAVRAIQVVGIIILLVIFLWVCQKVAFFKKNESERILSKLQKAIGQANSLLFEEKVLMGSESNSKLLLVYVSVDGCRQELSAESQDDQLFQKALLEYSCSYTCCLTLRYFPWNISPHPGHLEGGVCFCQYVRHQLAHKKTYKCCPTKFCFNCCKTV